MSVSPLLGLTDISEGVVNQATVHNTAIHILEAISYRALSQTTTTPAVGPAEGDSYIIPAGATGVWSGKTNQIACWVGGAWAYRTPFEGIGGIWVNDEDAAVTFDGAAWVTTGGAVLSAPYTDTTAIVKGSSDSTKRMRFEVDGLTTATTRVVTVPDKNGTMAMLDDVTTAVAALVASAPGALDTLDELAAALGDDANYAATVTASLAAKVAGPASAVGDRVALFDGATGKLIKDSGLTIAGTNTGDETATTLGATTHAATTKSAMVDADEIGLLDSAASFILKRATFTNLKAFLKTYFDTLYGSGNGSVTSVSVVTANGVSGSVATATTTPAITLTLGAITPSTVNGVTVSGASTPTLAVTGTTSVSGANTGDQTTVSGNAGTATTLQTSRNIDGQAFDGSANITVIAPGTHAATGKTTPVDADEIPLVDSAASNVLKKLTWANLKATAKTYFDTLYAPVVQPFAISTFYPGVPSASALIAILAAPSGITTLTFAAAIAGSSGKALTAATAQTDFDVRKNATTSANGTSVGTVRFAAAGTVPTFIAASGFTLTGGTDWLTVWAPATPDATLADIGISLYATR